MISGIILIVLGLALTFFGRKLVKTIFFVAGGLIGTLLTLYFFSQLVGEPLIYIAAIIAFVVVGFLFYKLLPIGAGLVAGLMAFLLLEPIIKNLVIAFILALIVLIVVIVLFNKLLTIGTALLGSIIFVAGLGLLTPLNSLAQLLLIIVFTVLGCVVQLKT